MNRFGCYYLFTIRIHLAKNVLFELRMPLGKKHSIDSLAASNYDTGLLCLCRFGDPGIQNFENGIRFYR